ncbi:hypothetical protein NN561_000196 [Cricetulus griseus]
MDEAAGAAAAAMGSRCSWELRGRGGGCRAGRARGAGQRSGSGGEALTAGTVACRLGRLPGKMAVGLAEPLSLLRRSGLPGEPAPNSAACPRRGPRGRTAGLGARASPGCTKS